MEYKLRIEEKKKLCICAREIFSNEALVVEEGEKYEFRIDPKDKWVDWFIPSNADGFCNILLLNKFKRVPNEKCFKLCGTIGKNEYDHFPIGTFLEWCAPKPGRVFFFANDSNNLKRYKNNRGQIQLEILRVE